jgi:hypothetical protein
MDLASEVNNESSILKVLESPLEILSGFSSYLDNAKSVQTQKSSLLTNKTSYDKLTEMSKE